MAASKPATPRKLEIEVLNQLIDDEEGWYRLKLGSSRVGYLTVPGGIFDDDTMCQPNLLIPKLPELPQSEWTRIRIDAGDTGSLKLTVDDSPLPEVEGNWHHNHVDVLTLEYTERHRSGVHEVLYQGRPAIVKYATFDFEIQRMERETWAYWAISEYQRSRPDEKVVSPQFLGHVTENGRRMGLLLEKKDGHHASLGDLRRCEDTVRQIHRMGLVHGDVNRYNFLIDEDKTYMVDYEHTEDYEIMKGQAEIESLVSELSEETGRGGPGIVMQDDE